MALGLILGFSGLLAGARPADAASLEDIRQLEDLINATGVVTQVSDQCPASHAGFYERDNNGRHRLVLCRNVVNLADNPEYKTVLETMRGKLRDWQLTILDAGLLPEAETDRRATENHTTIYQMAQDPKLYNLPAYLAAADLALAGDPANKPRLIAYLKSSDSGLRYWGTVGFLSLNNKMDAADQAILRSLLNDPCGEVRAMASWILIRSGDVMSGQDCLNQLIKTPSPARLFALNVLDWMHPDSIAPYQASLMAMSSPKASKKIGKQERKLNTIEYESDIRRYLLESHGLKDDAPQVKNELP